MLASTFSLRAVGPATLLSHKCDILSLLKDDQSVRDNRLPDGTGKGWDRKGLLGEENMLVRSNVLRFQQDISHHNALPFCRHYGILCSCVQSKKLVVRRHHVSIFKLVLFPATYFRTWYFAGTFHPYFSLLIVPNIIMVVASHIVGNDLIGMTSGR